MNTRINQNINSPQKEKIKYEDCKNLLRRYLEETEKEPFFISSWDVGKDVCLPKKILRDIIPALCKRINEYCLVEENDLQKKVSNYLIDRLGVNIFPKQVIIGSNATSLLCFVMLLLSSNKGNTLILEPSYFPVHDVLSMLHTTYYSVNISMPEFSYDFGKIEEIFKNSKINTIVITDPIFGSGIPIKKAQYMRLIKLANKYHCTLLVDMARMGLQWSKTDEPILGEMLELITIAESYAVIYSPCKKVFANGIKTGILIMSNNLLDIAYCFADSILGSATASQATFLETLLLPESRDYVASQINKNTMLAKNRYGILYTIVHNQLHLIEPQMGHYALVTFPKTHYTELELFGKLLFEANVYTLPMDLYGYDDADNYTFRINLLLDLEELINGIESIIAILKNSEQ